MTEGWFRGVREESRQLNELVFTHRYELPRGRSSLAPANLAEPLMYPVVDYPLERMSLLQILIRVGASEREPFRRAQLVLPSIDMKRDTLAIALKCALAQTTLSFGSALDPVVLSLRRLLDSGAKLEATHQLLGRRDRSGVYAACRQFLELGVTDDPDEAEYLAAILIGGNAWLFIDDDRTETRDMASVPEMLSAVFGLKGALSHVPIVVMTADKKAKILDDAPIYTLSEAPTSEPETTCVRATSSFVAACCRWLAFWGTPPSGVTLIAALLLAMPLVAFSVTNYEGVYSLMTGGPASSLHLPLSANVLRGSIISATMVGGWIVPMIRVWLF